MVFQPRHYRNWVNTRDLVRFNVVVEESDCAFSALSNLENKARQAITKYRAILKKYIAAHPLFLHTLEPYTCSAGDPSIIQDMAECGARAGVGPMAAVAGAIAQHSAADLTRFSSELIIENGGDIYLKSRIDRLLGVYAGNSPLSGRIGIRIAGRSTPLGISASSGTVGHSLSFGKADAVVILAASATLSDAVATAVGNSIRVVEDIPPGLEKARRIEGIKGVLIIKDDRMGVWGDLQLQTTRLED